MPEYRCYLFNFRGSIHKAEVLFVADDEQAKSQAMIMLATQGFHGYEIWQDARRVYVHMVPATERVPREDAAVLLNAVDAVRKAGEAGRPAQTLTHGINATDAVRWSGGDPYPYPYRLHG
jgi:hypothetical protein